MKALKYEGLMMVFWHGAQLNHYLPKKHKTKIKKIKKATILPHVKMKWHLPTRIKWAFFFSNTRGKF